MQPSWLWKNVLVGGYKDVKKLYLIRNWFVNVSRVFQPFAIKDFVKGGYQNCSFGWYRTKAMKRVKLTFKSMQYTLTYLILIMLQLLTFSKRQSLIPATESSRVSYKVMILQLALNGKTPSNSAIIIKNFMLFQIFQIFTYNFY